MRHVFGTLLIVVTLGVFYLLHQRADNPTAEASKVNVVQKKEPLVKIDKSAKMQEGRKQLIEKLGSQGVFQKIETPGNLPRLWVTPRFHSLDFDKKKNFVSVVYAYYFDGYNITDVVRIYDSKSGKEIGAFSSSGLDLF